MRHEEFLQAYLPTKRQGLAINVGAHDGEWVGQFVPMFSSVIAIEANPIFCDRLRAQFKPAPVGNVEVIEAAGWICSGQKMSFHVRETRPMESALACRDPLRDDAVSETIQVDTIAIDDIAKTSCDLIFVDVEGADVHVLMGATRTVEQYKPQLIIECHEIEHREWLTRWLERAGYNLAIVHHPGYDKSDPKWESNVYLIGSFWRYRGTW